MKAANRAMVGIVAAVCMMGLIVVLRNILSISADVLSRDMIIYVVVYFGFITAVNIAEELPGDRMPRGRPMTTRGSGAGSP